MNSNNDNDDNDADDADDDSLTLQQASKRARRPFTPGAYPTHVFLQVSTVNQRSQALLRRTFRDFGQFGIAWKSLHVSLCRSAPVDVQYGATLESELRSAVRLPATVNALIVSTSAVKLLSNDDCDRTFLTLVLDSDSDAGKRVLEWIAAVNRVFAKFGLQPYHESPIPHISIASVAESIATMQCACESPTDNCCALQDARNDEFMLSDTIEFQIDSLIVQSGALRVEIPLQQR
jgi:hypothetical protein